MFALIIAKEYQNLTHTASKTILWQNKIAAKSLNQWVKHQEQKLEALALLPVLTLEKLPQINTLLATEAHLEPDWNLLALVDTKGNVLVTSRNKSTKIPYSQLLPIISNVIVTGKPSISDYMLCPFTKTPCVLITAPVFQKKKIKNILVASVKPKSILKLFMGLGEQEGSVVAVLDSNSRVLARTLENERWLGKDFSNAHTVQAAKKSKPGTIETIGIADSILRTYAFDEIPNVGWLVIVGVPTHILHGSSYDRLVMLTILILLAITFSIILAYTVTSHFTGPIKQLVKEAIAIGRGDLTKRVSSNAGGELGLLARAFNQMAINLELNQEHKYMVEKISESIRQSLDLDQILNTTVSELGRALSASRCCLALLDRHTKSINENLEFNYVWWNPNKAGTSLKNRSIIITENSILKLILKQSAILSLDIVDDNTLGPLFEQEESLHTDWQSIKSLIACPIILQEEPVGMILVHQCDARRTWLDPELELVEAIARHVALAMSNANLFARTKTLAEQEFLINRIVQSIRSSLDADTILSTVTSELGRALSVDYCQIAQPHQAGPLIITHEYYGSGFDSKKGLSLYGGKLDFNPDSINFKEYNSILGIDLTALKEFGHNKRNILLREPPIAVVTDIKTDKRTFAYRQFLDVVGSKSLIAAPLLRDDRLLGILIIHQCTNKRDWTPSEVHLIAAVADQLAVAISHAELFAQVRQQAITDGLTGLYNHVYFKNRLHEELSRAQRKSALCGLLMIDLDHLKQINDTLGHPIGDAAIREIASVLKSILRSGDTASRYGGEEFAVILPDTSLLEVSRIAERLRTSINRTPVPHLGFISASIGAAIFPNHAKNSAELIEVADQALYIAKRLGRNRVHMCDQPISSTHNETAKNSKDNVIL
jgi:diguanylate cyclase (GGDEF)-like protein